MKNVEPVWWRLLRLGGRRLAAWHAAACWLAAPAAAQPDIVAMQAVERDVRLVQDLLELDAQAALAAERRRAAPPEGPVPGYAGSGAAPTPDAPARSLRLAAIYGVSGRLHADVVIDGALHTYRAGRPLPVGVPHGFGLPRMTRIAGACAEFDRGDGPQRLCLAKGAGEAP